MGRVRVWLSAGARFLAWGPPLQLSGFACLVAAAALLGGVVGGLVAGGLVLVLVGFVLERGD